MIRTLIFDFDGVIAQTVDIKTEAFRELFKDYPDHWQEIKRYHLLNGGISRFQKFRYFYKNILKKPLSQGGLKELGKRFRWLVLEKTIRAPLVKGAKSLLDSSLERYQMFVVSGTPQKEIIEIVRRRNMSRYFTGVYGSPRTKNELIKKILQKNKIKPVEAIFIGDSLSDLRAAKQSKVNFIARAVDRGTAWLNDQFISAIVKDMRAIAGLLKKLDIIG